MPCFRSSASFGKRQEFGAIAELLRRGYDVYVTLVDDQQIDGVVRQWPRRNYIFILYAEAVGERGTYQRGNLP